MWWELAVVLIVTVAALIRRAQMLTERDNRAPYQPRHRRGPA